MLPAAHSGISPDDLHQVSVVIVLFNSADVITECLASIPADVETIVVDNASTDDGAEIARRARPDAIVVGTASNLGFGGGCNLGAMAASRSFVLFVNPDARVTVDAVLALAARTASTPHSIVAPEVRDVDGTVHEVRHPLSAWRFALQLLPASERWVPAALRLTVHRSDPVYSSGGPVAFAYGACFMMRRHDLATVGGFDTDLFLYCEEASLAKRIERLGGVAWYEPTAVVTHIGGTSTQKTGHVLTYNVLRSRSIFLRKSTARGGAVLGLTVMAGALLAALPNAAVSSLTGRERMQTISWWSAAARGLIAGAFATLREPKRY